MHPIFNSLNAILLILAILFIFCVPVMWVLVDIKWLDEDFEAEYKTYRRTLMTLNEFWDAKKKGYVGTTDNTPQEEMKLKHDYGYNLGEYGREKVVSDWRAE